MGEWIRIYCIQRAGYIQVEAAGTQYYAGSQSVGGGAKEVHCHSRHFHAFDMDGDPSAALDLERGAVLDLEVH